MTFDQRYFAENIKVLCTILNNYTQYLNYPNNAAILRHGCEWMCITKLIDSWTLAFN